MDLEAEKFLLKTFVKAEDKKTPKGCFTKQEWENIIEKNFPLEKISKKKLRNSFIHGIPQELRGTIWKYICQVEKYRKGHSEGVYAKLLEIYNEDDEFCINKDLTRTITGFQGFKINPTTGQNKLFNLLKAYANFDF